MVMPVGLTIIGDVNQLRPGSLARKGTIQTVGKVLTTHEQVAKGDIMRHGTIVKKESEISP